MKIGFRHPTDISIQWVRFECNGNEHFVAFKFSAYKGFEHFSFDGYQNLKIIETSPAVMGVIWYVASMVMADVRFYLRKFFGAIFNARVR